MFEGKVESLYFATAPQLQELCSITLTVPPTQSQTSQAGYQPHIIRSRELIFTEPEILATPLLNQDGKLQIIMQQSLFRTGRLQARFQKMGLQASKPKRVLAVDLQCCLRYTLLAKLAPTWNKVGDYLVQGRDFITSTQKMNAINMDLVINEEEFYVCLKAHNIRMPPIRLQDLNICRPVLHDFLVNKPFAVINEYSIETKWCHILPSMKKGQVVNVCHQIPPDSPYSSYKEMKRYWKNTYGIRLPDSDEGMPYYQVYFKPIGNILFTYPECCIRPRDIIRIGRSDPRTVLEGFLQDLHGKMPSVCGQKLQFAPQAKYPVNNLLDICQLEEEEEEFPNLTDQQPNGQHTHYRASISDPPVRPTWTPSASQPIINSKNNFPTANLPGQSQSNMNAFNASKSSSSRNTISNATSMSNRSYSQMGDTFSCTQPAYSHGIPQNRDIDNHPNDSIGLSHQATQDGHLQSQRMIPKFVSKVPAKPVFGLCKSQASAAPKQVPMFKVTKPRSIPASSACTPGATSFSQNVSSACGSGSSSRIQEPMAGSTAPNITLNPKNGTAPIFDSGLSFNTELINSRPTPTVKPSFASRLSSNFKPKSYSKTSQSLYNRTPQAITNRAVPGATPNSAISMSGSTSRSYATPTSYTASSTPLSSMSQNAPAYSDSAHKRKMQMSEGEVKAKKPRAKPKVQEGINIEALARNNQLGKVNAATLTSWLKERGVVCRSKDKKPELVDKVKHLLHIAEP